METLILYHRDMDGLASALIARKKYPDAEMRSVQYGEKFNIELVSPFKRQRIILVDFSYDKEIMNIIIDGADDFIWIDHHKTAKELPMWNNKEVKGLRSIEKAACEFTWEYFFPLKKVPMPIQYIADRDMWMFQYNNLTKAFHEMLMLNENNIELINEVLFHPTKYLSWINQGALLLKYQQEFVKKIYKKGSTITWNEHKTYTMHTPVFPSELADYAFKQNPEIEVARIIQEKWDKEDGWLTINSLRSRGNVDVSEIAKKYGGGGHHNAAGYSYR